MLWEELGDGEYLAEPVALSMPSYWTVGVKLALDAEPAELVEFGFCMP